jgi:hypothetical protein
MAVLRVKSRWTIPGAGVAYSVMHFGDGGDPQGDNTDADNSTLAVSTFFSGIMQYVPSVVQVKVESDVELLSAESGELITVLQSAERNVLTGGAAANQTWAAPAGACITWNTAGIRTVTSTPRRVRGRTFLVPLASGAFDIDGTINSVAMTALNNAATGLRGNFSNQQFGIYARPSKTPSVPGAFHTITGHRITDQAAILRSRRT